MDFRLPELGEGVYEAELIRWLVQPGDTVKRGQSLMEVMTDKATMEVPSPFAGRITELRAQPGQEIKVGEVVLTYAAAEQPQPVPTAPAGEEAAAVAPSVPTAAEQVAPVQRPGGDGRVARQEPRPPVRQEPRPPTAAAPVRAAPSVRLLARKLGIDLSQVQGSGPGGRILVEDLTAYLKAAPPEEKPQPARLRGLALDFGKPGTRIKLAGLRRKIAEHMVVAKRTIPDYGYVDECDVTDLVRLRDMLRETYAQAGIRLTYLAFFVKATVAALKEVPIVNASLDEEAGEIVLHDRYHIGIAVATPGGLIVPVIRDADRMDLAQIAREIERLSSDARAGRTRLEDLRGSTFTITSIGGIGGLFSTPIINYPEVGILGIGRVIKRPVFDAAGHVRPADMVYLSFCFDHRVVDGAVGAAFGNAVIRHLKNPAALLVSCS